MFGRKPWVLIIHMGALHTAKCGKWKGGNLTDWIIGLNFSFPCNSINHSHPCCGLKVAGMHAPLHDFGPFTCHPHDMTCSHHSVRARGRVSSAPLACAAEWDRSASLTQTYTGKLSPAEPSRAWWMSQRVPGNVWSSEGKSSSPLCLWNILTPR